MKSRSAPFFVFCFAGVSVWSFAWADDPAIQYVPAHGEPYGMARKRLIASGWEPIPASCDRKHVCWGPDKPELASALEANTNCGQFRKAAKILRACTYVIPDAILIDSVTFADEN